LNDTHHNLHRVREDPFDLWTFDIRDYEALNESILSELSASKSEWSFSHRINGRCENVYAPIRLVPAVRRILSCVHATGTRILGQRTVVPHEGSGLPFNAYWFNIATPGESTGRHRHTSDAVLSGVYYLQVPGDSGAIVFSNPDDDTKIEWPPRAGAGLIFPADTFHSVSINRSRSVRISFAFNLYTVPIKIAPSSFQAW